MPTFEDMTPYELLVFKFKNRGAIAFVTSIFVFIIARNLMMIKIDKLLTAFFETTMRNYDNGNA